MKRVLIAAILTLNSLFSRTSESHTEAVDTEGGKSFQFS